MVFFFCVKLFYLIFPIFYFSEPNNGMQRLDIQPAGKFSDHNCTVWRTAWNVTGTMLATTGDDGYVRMWKSKKRFCTLDQF